MPQNNPKPPSWDLSDLYASPEDPKLKNDIEFLTKNAEDFEKNYKGSITNLSTQALYEAIQSYEALEDLSGKISAYAYLSYAEKQSDPMRARLWQNTSEALNDINQHLLFFTLEINQIEDQEYALLISAGSPLRHYTSWLNNVRIFRPYQLSEDLEKLFHEKSVVSQAWIRLFDETFASMQILYRKKHITCTEAMDLLSSKDAAERKDAALAFGNALKEKSELLALITNILAKDKSIEDKWRKLPRPISSRNLDNIIEDEVVDALIEAVKDSFPSLSHRYYSIKANWMGQKKLEYWDRNAPLPDDNADYIPWKHAVEIVLASYEAFSPRLRKLGEPFFQKHWIDAAPHEGKDSGAFSHPVVPSAHPYILMNYQGKIRDVMTLAHELGHGVHQCLSAGQGALMADTPLTLAETASVFGEQLTFRSLLKREKDNNKQNIILAGKVEDMLNTVVRQVAFCEFERIVHDERKKGELAIERLNEIWMQVQSESLGPAIHLSGDYQYFWSYIPHFIHSPFYVYSYAFGDCLVNALYARYLEGDKNFEEKYFTMLEAGGTLHHKELLSPFGLDATKPEFWKMGLGVIESFIDQLKTT